MKLIEKIKNSKVAKVVCSAFVASAVAAMGVIGCCATDGEPASASATLSSSLSTVQSDLMGYIAIVLPVALAIFGAIWGIKKAISFFKSTAR